MGGGGRGRAPRPPSRRSPLPRGTWPLPRGTRPLPPGSRPPPRGSRPLPSGPWPPPRGARPPLSGRKAPLTGARAPLSGRRAFLSGASPGTPGKRPGKEKRIPRSISGHKTPGWIGFQHMRAQRAPPKRNPTHGDHQTQQRCLDRPLPEEPGRGHEVLHRAFHHPARRLADDGRSRSTPSSRPTSTRPPPSRRRSDVKQKRARPEGGARRGRLDARQCQGVHRGQLRRAGRADARGLRLRTRRRPPA